MPHILKKERVRILFFLLQGQRELLTERAINGGGMFGRQAIKP